MPATPSGDPYLCLASVTGARFFDSPPALRADVGVSVVPRGGLHDAVGLLECSFIWFFPQILIEYPLCTGAQGHRGDICSRKARSFILVLCQR